jgi:hypothetical protein
MIGYRTYKLNTPGDCRISIQLDEVISFHEVETQGGKVILVHMSGGQSHCLSGVTFDEFLSGNFTFQQR